jgi:hypothetical protein
MGAQADVAVPQTRNIAQVARRAARVSAVFSAA